MSGGETAIYSDGDSSTGETTSLYQLQDGRHRGCSNGDSIPDPRESLNRVAIFMAGTQPVLGSTAATAMTSSAAAVTAAGASRSARPPAQVLTDLLEALASLMEVDVTPDNQEQHKVEVAKLHDEIAQAKADLAAENARMAAERAVLNAQAQRIQADSYRLMVDQNASHEVLMRKHRSRLPLVYESRNLFSTPGAGASNPPVNNQTAEAPDQPRVTEVNPTDQDQHSMKVAKLRDQIAQAKEDLAAETQG